MADPTQGALPSVLEDLRECAFRGVTFPTTQIVTSVRQDHAIHKFPDRDGAHVEATGRAPLEFRITAPFRNGIAPGKSEAQSPGRWGALYPDHFRIKFLPAVLDRTTGDFQHPELGVIKAKVVSMDFTIDPHKRDGVDVDLTLIESFDSPDDLKSVVAKPSPIGTTLQFASDLDSQITQVTPLQSPGNLFTSLQTLSNSLAQQITDSMSQSQVFSGNVTNTFASVARLFQTVSDQGSLLSRQQAGRMDQLQYRVNAVEDSVYALKDPTLWPILNSSERLKASLADLKREIANVATKQVSIYIVPGVQTLAQVAITTGNKVDDLIKLNPQLASAPTIARQTVVRYYTVS